jgi:hypothetical protein
VPAAWRAARAANRRVIRRSRAQISRISGAISGFLIVRAVA